MDAVDADRVRVDDGERLAELEHERARLEAIFAHLPVGLTIADADGNIVRANREALRILGIESDADPLLVAWREAPVFDLDGNPVSFAERPLGRTLATGETVTGRFEVAARRGRVVVDISSAPVRDGSGQFIGAVTVLQDVTIRDRRERAEREFVTNAAHELQSPLAAIVAAVDVLQSGAKDSDERDLFLDHVEREAARLTRLAQTLLVLARAQTGFEAPRGELVELEPLLREIGDSLQPAAGVAVEVECDRRLAVVTNADLVAHAIVNLAENAAKNTEAGRVVLEARRVGDMVAIAVVDTGRGIPPAERPKVFDRFYRGGGADIGGFGLGLALVRSAVEAVGGEIELDSTVGAGTIVRLRLPNAATVVHE